MIIEKIIDNKFIERTSDDKKKILHKIGTGEYYSSALDVITSTYEYEEVDNPDYIEENPNYIENKK